ncbi:MAG: hypothetical protein ABFD92_17730 [Planctomycetaceae bacterium]|nr:hypothetical protein [Planctomycetaceae bacterium]
MSEQPQDQTGSPAGGGCQACGRACKFADAGMEASPLSSWRMTLCAAEVFLLPLAMAAGGAVIGGPAQGGQLIGCLVGLVGGIALAIGAVRLIGGLKERS